MKAIETHGLTKFYGRARGIEGKYLIPGIALALIGIAAAFIKYNKKDIRA